MTYYENGSIELMRQICGELQLQARTQATINDGWGNKSVIIKQVTLDGEPEAPTSLKRAARNESCLSLQWKRPLVTNGQITAYKVNTFSYLYFSVYRVLQSQ